MTRHFLIVLTMLTGLLTAWQPVQAALPAATLPAADVEAIHQAVQRQLDALKKGDAAGAFALTTDDTRNRLGTPDKFLQVIKEQYDPVYRHRLAMLSTIHVINGKVYQLVRLTDQESHVWVAIYAVNKDKQGAWKIDGCELFQTKTIAV